MIENYLKNSEDTHSLTTGTSDEGIGSHSAPTDLAMEEPCGKSKSLVFAGHLLPNLLLTVIANEGNFECPQLTPRNDIFES